MPLLCSVNLADARWTLRAAGSLEHVPGPLQQALQRGIPATVPGCVHTDLMAAGMLEDPSLGDNELRQYWIGRVDWRYDCTLGIDPALLARGRIDLAADGLDTVARVELNGRLVGESANMHCAHRFDLRPAARAGKNALSIRFAAPMTHAEQQERLHPPLPREGGASGKLNPHNFIRKMSCNMGWDWGPEVTTAGIWRPIRLEAWDLARIAAVRPLVLQATAERAVLAVHVDLEPAGPDTPTPAVRATLQSPDGQTLHPVHERGRWLFTIPRPKRWWPVGHGHQPLYTLDVALLDERGDVLHRQSRRLGLRTVELRTDPDPDPVGDPIPHRAGERMTLCINGKPIYLKGANWIPDDCFPHRVTPQRYRQRVQQALDAHMNVLRVWAGGIYEDHAFYDACDELGLLVWQDFAFACATYTEEPPYDRLVEAEARDNVARLSHHPSLVMWNGCNETVMATFDWGPHYRAIREEGKHSWGLGFFLGLLPRVVKELDPSRPYWPASPWSGSMDRHPNANEFGNVHMWDVWHGAGQYRNYLGHFPRLATEFGYHAPPAYATLARAIAPEDRQWDSRVMKLHNKNARPGQEQTNTRMADDFVPPTHDYDAWHYLAQVMQARALTMGIEWFRALYPWNSGAMFWQFNDCWPVSSWSCLDGDGRPKPMWFAARRFFAPRLITIKPRRVTPSHDAIGPLAVYLHNDTDHPWNASVLLTERRLDGEVVRSQSCRVEVAPRSLEKFDVPEAMRQHRDAFLVAEAGTHRGFWWFAPDKELDYPLPRFDAERREQDGEQVLTLTARSLLRDLCVFPDRLDPAATIDDGFLTLLPGDTATLRIRGRRRLSLDELIAPPVLQCVNGFGASAPTPAGSLAAT
jgi:beta-mannosidase